jgi:hypothetical protein
MKFRKMRGGGLSIDQIIGILNQKERPDLAEYVKEAGKFEQGAVIILFKDIKNVSEDDKINEAIRILTMKKESYDSWQARLAKAPPAAAPAPAPAPTPPAATGIPYSYSLVSHHSHNDYILDHKDIIKWPKNEQNEKIGFEETIDRHGSVINNISTLTRIILNPIVAKPLDERDPRYEEKNRFSDGKYYIITGREYNSNKPLQSYVYEKVNSPNICRKVGLYTGMLGSISGVSFDN